MQSGSPTNPTFDLSSTGNDGTIGGLARHGSTLGPSQSGQGFSLHTLSTTATFRNKALTIRNKDEVSETVRESKPNYRLGMVLGRGGFSTVYAAMNSKTGELMAAKKLQFPSDDDSTERNIQMLQNEVSLMRALDHPHVIKYLFCDQPEPGSAVSSLPAGESDVEEFFIVMEYVGGGSLHDLVKNFGELSDEASASFIAQVLLGVEYLHSTGRVHRDMKPGNVLLRSDGHVKISDFGTSLDFRNRDGDDVVSGFRVDHMAGTPLYSPPEALRGTLNRNRATREERKKMKEEAELDEDATTVDEVLAYSVAYDVWGIGCTAMELLTGKRPWAHLSSNALKSLTMLVDEAAEIEKRLEDDEWETGGDDGAADVKTCPTLPPGLSENARSFLESCLKVDPMARLNATALLCHPWIQQYDLIDTKASPLHGFVPMGVETGVLSTRASSTSRLSQWNESRLTADQRKRLSVGLAVAASASGPGAAISLGIDPSTMHAPTVREDRKSVALDAAQSAFVNDKDRAVRKNMNRLVHKTRALMRLGAFKSMAKPAGAGAAPAGSDAAA
jgi:serine/threonine protein kinase